MDALCARLVDATALLDRIGALPVGAALLESTTASLEALIERVERGRAGPRPA